MEIIIIVLIILAFIGIVVIAVIEKGMGILPLLGVALIFLTGLVVMLKVERSTAIKALQGKNPYTMRINYQKINDSIFIPKDTIFIDKSSLK